MGAASVLPIDRGGRHLLRRASLRRQVVALEALRDALKRESEGDYDRIAKAMIPVTDRVLHELMELEGVSPYPHPIGREWWRPAYAERNWPEAP